MNNLIAYLTGMSFTKKSVMSIGNSRQKLRKVPYEKIKEEVET